MIMEKLFEGLLQYEILLSILGIVLFLVLLFLLVYMIVTGKTVNKLLGFFIIPILMIGYPGIKKIQFKGFIIDLEETVAESPENGPTEDQKEEVEDIISRFNTDRISLPENNITVARAYAIIGDTLKAYKATEKALEVDPSSASAVNLRDKYSANTMVRIDQIIQDVKQDPSNESLKGELDQTLQKVEPGSLASPADYYTMAKAKEALGQRDEAKQYIDTVLTMNPKYKNARNLKRQVIK
jgi:tetratricopeptide (TPR) repeat protein